MSRQAETLYHKTVEDVVKFCSYVADSYEITAAFIIGEPASTFKVKTVWQVLLVLRDFKPRLLTYLNVFRRKSVILFAVDQWVFERDVDRGFLGEALAGGLIFSYTPILGESYLHLQEVKLKKRLICEMLENLVLNFPELSYVINIKPEYFLYEALLTRVRLFPPIISDVIEFMRGNCASLNRALPGYLKALKELEKAKILDFSDGFVKVSSEIIDNAKKKKIRFLNLFRTAQKALFNSLLGFFPKSFTFLMENKDLLKRFRFAEDFPTDAFSVKDPQAFLYIPTAEGLVSLTSKINIEVFARKVLSAGEKVPITVERMGSVLNDTYLIKASWNNNERKIVAKRFRDWSSFKWFPLTLWTFGTRTFAVLGRSRLERECALNQLLHSRGFTVPKLLHVDHGERLVLMEYIDGENVERKVKRLAEAKRVNEVKAELDLLRKVGEKFAEIHAFNIALGDAKPENIIIKKDGQICFVDFEQAARNGDKTWDIAELLYYSGHYFSPFSKAQVAEHAAKAFIEGYLNAGGNISVVKKAGNPKYTKVFSVFTLPHILLTISETCKKAEKLKE